MKLLISVILAGACAQPVLACDLCSVYAATEAQGESGKGFFGGVAEQFTHFGTLQEDGHKIPGEGQYIDSSVAQVFGGYNFNDDFGVQLNLPVIYRAYGSDTMHGTESGIGDLTLLGTYTPYRKLKRDFSLSWTLIGGVKFPTGDSSRLNTPDSELPEELAAMTWRWARAPTTGSWEPGCSRGGRGCLRLPTSNTPSEAKGIFSTSTPTI